MRFLTKDELPLVQLLIQNDIADNVYRASAIVVGCELASLPTDEERLARARLYRAWRNSQIYGKRTEPCYEKAIKGEVVPMDDFVTRIVEEVAP